MANYTFSIIVRNKPGVLAQISDLFRRRDYNIETIRAGKYKRTELTKIRIVATGKDDSLQSFLDQLGAVSDIVKVAIPNQRVYSFWLVAYCLCITLLGTNLPAPLYSVYKTEWAMSPGIVTFIYALYALVVIPTIVLVAQCADRWGRKQALLAGLLCSFLGSAGFALADGVSALIASRILQGISVGILNGIAVSYMTELHPTQDRMKSAFIAAIAGTTGNAAAPLVSGLLGEYAAYPLQTPYAVHLILTVVGFLGLRAMLEKGTVSKKIPLHLPKVAAPFKTAFFLASSTAFLSWGIMSLMLSVLPAYLNLFTNVNSLALSGAVVALVLGVSSFAQVVGKSRPVIQLIAAGNVLLALGLLCLIATLVTKSLGLLLLTTIFIGLGNGPSYAGSLAYLNQQSSDEQRANLTSLFFVMTYVGISIPMITLGYVGEWVGLPNAIIGYAVTMASLLIVSLFFWMKHHSR